MNCKLNDRELLLYGDLKESELLMVNEWQMLSYSEQVLVGE